MVCKTNSLFYWHLALFAFSSQHWESTQSFVKLHSANIAHRLFTPDYNNLILRIKMRKSKEILLSVEMTDCHGDHRHFWRGGIISFKLKQQVTSAMHRFNSRWDINGWCLCKITLKSAGQALRQLLLLSICLISAHLREEEEAPFGPVSSATEVRCFGREKLKFKHPKGKLSKQWVDVFF